MPTAILPPRLPITEPPKKPRPTILPPAPKNGPSWMCPVCLKLFPTERRLFAHQVLRGHLPA